jgi:hypothetical protein
MNNTCLTCCRTVMTHGEHGLQPEAAPQRMRSSSGAGTAAGAGSASSSAAAARRRRWPSQYSRRCAARLSSTATAPPEKLWLNGTAKLVGGGPVL